MSKNENDIAKVRLKKGISSIDMSKEIGIDRSHLHRIEQGDIEPKIGLASKIAKFLGIPIEQLWKFGCCALILITAIFDKLCR